MDVMRTQFFIAVHINTANGPETIARFRIGNNPQQASQIFYLLKGDNHVGGTDTLRLDFMEMKNGLLINLRMISCTSDQLAENCKIITEELFMFSGLGEHERIL